MSDLTKRFHIRIGQAKKAVFTVVAGKRSMGLPAVFCMSLLLSGLAWSGAPSVRIQSTCLSISPFRAIPALAGIQDTLTPEQWRDLTLKELRRQRPDSAWFFRKAGDCPESMATIDVFQLPGDVLASTDGQVLRFRLEWRHTPGQTEFFLSASGRTPPTSPLISKQLLAVADQMMARVEVSSMPVGADVGLGARNGARRIGQCPMVLLVPPGALSLEFSLQDKIRRSDTLVEIGGFYEVHADFRTARIDPKTRVEQPNAWPLWSLTLASVLGGIWAAREQALAQRAYDRLGKDDKPSTFSARWDDLRTANILRNGFFSASVVFGIGTAWMEWSNAN